MKKIYLVYTAFLFLSGSAGAEQKSPLEPNTSFRVKHGAVDPWPKLANRTAVHAIDLQDALKVPAYIQGTVEDIFQLNGLWWVRLRSLAKAATVDLDLATSESDARRINDLSAATGIDTFSMIAQVSRVEPADASGRFRAVGKLIAYERDPGRKITIPHEGSPAERD